MAVDGSGNVVVVGYSNAAWGTPVRGYSSGLDAFSAKLDNDGAVLWNTFLGGALSDNAFSVAIDLGGNVYVGGYGLATWGSPVRGYSSGWDAFAAKLDNDGVLLWNTFLGGAGFDEEHALAVDGAGNVYVGGDSSITWGSPMCGYKSGWDVFAAKIDSSGMLVWNTFLGGAGIDYGYALTLDDGGNVYVGGYSTSTWGTPVRGYGSGNDAFVAKLGSNGMLLWSTFLGGDGDDNGNALAVDGSGNVYACGTSNATWGTPVRGYGSGNDAYAAKLDSNGVLVWNTFLGGAAHDYGYALAVDSSGNVYVGGYSIGAWGSPVRGYSSGLDTIAVKLNSSGGIVWSTFLGGAGSDYGYALVVDNSGNVYVGGTSSATWGLPVRVFGNGLDAMAIKLNNSGALMWNTFLGGAGSDNGYALAVDDSGNVYVGGYSNATWGAPVRGYNSGLDAMAVKLNSSGVLVWNTFLGGAGSDYGRALVVDNGGNVYVGGYGDATWGTPVRGYSSANDGFIAKLSNSGALLWNMFMGGMGNDNGRALVLDLGGNVYMGGYSDAPWGTPLQGYGGESEAFVAKIDDAFTATNTPTDTSTVTSSATPTPSATVTWTPTSTHTSSITATLTPSYTASTSSSSTPSLTATPLVTVTNSHTATSTPTPSEVYTPYSTLTFTCTKTPAPNPTSTPELHLIADYLVRDLSNYPNPFLQQKGTTICYWLSEDARVELQVFTYLGDRVWNVSFAPGEAGGRGNPGGGENLITWDGRGNHGGRLAAGGYILRVHANSVSGKSETATRKVVISSP